MSYWGGCHLVAIYYPIPTSLCVCSKPPKNGEVGSREIYNPHSIYHNVVGRLAMLAKQRCSQLLKDLCSDNLPCWSIHKSTWRRWKSWSQKMFFIWTYLNFYETIPQCVQSCKQVTFFITINTYLRKISTSFSFLWFFFVIEIKYLICLFNKTLLLENKKHVWYFPPHKSLWINSFHSKKFYLSFILLMHQAPANRWSLVSHIVSVRPYVCSSVRSKNKTKTRDNARWGLVDH